MMNVRIRVAENLQNYYRWWLEGLRYLLPASLRTRINKRVPVILLKFESDKWYYKTNDCPDNSSAVGWQNIETSGFARQHHQADYKTILLLPADAVLITQFSLPRAVREDLRQALTFEMDRRTPFSADQVYFDFRIIHDADSADVIDIELVAALRSRVDPQISHLAKLGIKPGRIDIESGEGLLGVNLLQPYAEKHTALNLEQRNERALWALAAAMLLVFLYLPLIQQHEHIKQLESMVAGERHVIQELEAIQRERDALLLQNEFLSRHSERPLTAIEVLDELSQRIPDDTWLQRFSMSNDSIQLVGESDASSALLSLIQDSPYFTNAQFRSPITHNDQTGREKYHLSAQLRRNGHATDN